MKIKFIINPAAGKGKALQVKQIIKNKLQQTQHHFSIEATAAPQDAIFLAQRTVSEKYDTIVAVGGDGTIYEVINGIAGSDINLGIIPAGTGNDLARTVGIPEDTDTALNLILQNCVKPIDIGSVNGKYFTNVASIGFDAEVVKELENIKKIASGTWAYIISVFKTLMTYRSKKVQLLLDHRLIEREILLVAIANGKFYGGGMMVAPNADISDGYLDICLINKVPKLRFVKLFPTIFKGTHVQFPEVEYFKAKQVKILTNGNIVNCDGEIVGCTPIAFKIADFKINLIVDKTYTGKHNKAEKIKISTK